EAIFTEVRTHLKHDKKMPTLLVCENIQQTEELLASMKQQLETFNPKKMRKLTPIRLQLFNGKKSEIYTLSKDGWSGPQPVEDATEAKINAGMAGTITITTPILGRGTDFKPILPNGQKHPKGLLVIQTYVDTERTSRQVIGRSGRQGHHGETVCIIDEE